MKKALLAIFIMMFMVSVFVAPVMAADCGGCNGDSCPLPDDGNDNDNDDRCNGDCDHCPSAGNCNGGDNDNTGADDCDGGSCPLPDDGDDHDDDHGNADGCGGCGGH